MNSKNKNNETGEFGPIYSQFEGKPKEAIKYLRKMKKGECVRAFCHPVIGYIDIVWGEVTDPVKHKGYGLSHIIDKHGMEIKQLGFEVEDFITIILLYGNLDTSKSGEEFLLESSMFRIVIEKKFKGHRKNWILTAFDLRNKKGCKI